MEVEFVMFSAFFICLKWVVQYPTLRMDFICQNTGGQVVEHSLVVYVKL